MADALLTVKGLVKQFGGLIATDNVSLTILRGEVHALIGPNGAGKTTLIAQLSGSLASDAGSLAFEDHDITALAQHERVRRGLAVYRIERGAPAMIEPAPASAATPGA